MGKSTLGSEGITSFEGVQLRTGEGRSASVQPSSESLAAPSAEQKSAHLNLSPGGVGGLNEGAATAVGDE